MSLDWAVAMIAWDKATCRHNLRRSDDPVRWYKEGIGNLRGGRPATAQRGARACR